MAGRKRVTNAANSEEALEEITEETTNYQQSKRNDFIIKHTETIDKLVIQNKALQKDLDEADLEISELETKLADNSIKISKNMFYTFLGLIILLVWFLNAKIVIMIETMVETKHIMREYKYEIEKIKLYNDILEKKVQGENNKND